MPRRNVSRAWLRTASSRRPRRRARSDVRILTGAQDAFTFTNLTTRSTASRACLRGRRSGRNHERRKRPDGLVRRHRARGIRTTAARRPGASPLGLVGAVQPSATAPRRRLPRCLRRPILFECSLLALAGTNDYSKTCGKCGTAVKKRVKDRVIRFFECWDTTNTQWGFTTVVVGMVASAAARGRLCSSAGDSYVGFWSGTELWHWRLRATPRNNEDGARRRPVTGEPTYKAIETVSFDG